MAYDGRGPDDPVTMGGPKGAKHKIQEQEHTLPNTLFENTGFMFLPEGLYRDYAKHIFQVLPETRMPFHGVVWPEYKNTST